MVEASNVTAAALCRGTDIKDLQVLDAPANSYPMMPEPPAQQPQSSFYNHPGPDGNSTCAQKLPSCVALTFFCDHRFARFARIWVAAGWSAARGKCPTATDDGRADESATPNAAARHGIWAAVAGAGTAVAEPACSAAGPGTDIRSFECAEACAAERERLEPASHRSILSVSLGVVCKSLAHLVAVRRV